jgi:hypothetical protein
MQHNHPLETSFRNYLESGLDARVAESLRQALLRAGLQAEAHALQRYLADGADARGQWTDPVWQNAPVSVGQNPPAQAPLGSVWFDVVELTPMVLLPLAGSTPPSSGVWLAMRPVYVWQFRTFVGLVDVGRTLTEFPMPSDFLAPDRFASLDSMAFITDMYHDEALAYAHWFGRTLVSQFDLQAARQSLPPAAFDAILPTGIGVWDGSEYPLSEFVRIAVRNNTLTKDIFAESEALEMGANTDLSDRMLYDEWERNGDIGITTAVFLPHGLICSLPRKTLFVELRNAAPRIDSGA